MVGTACVLDKEGTLLWIMSISGGVVRLFIPDLTLLSSLFTPGEKGFYFVSMNHVYYPHLSISLLHLWIKIFHLLSRALTSYITNAFEAQSVSPRLQTSSLRGHTDSSRLVQRSNRSKSIVE